MGPSGSGKSTLLNLIAGLDRPTDGTVTVAGQRIDTLGESALARFRARHIGIIFQFFNLLDDLTVEDNVLLPAQLAGASRRRGRARAAELLDRMGLADQRNAYPARLSGGQRQRVAIARALVNSPELLLADEPTGALDTATGQQIGRLLSELNAAGETLVLVTHDPALAARYAARTIQIVDGQVVDGQGAPVGAGALRVSGRAALAAEGAGNRGRPGRDATHGGSWLGPVRTASGGLRRHKVQTIVIAVVLFVATASATLGLALLAASNGPFTHAFSAAARRRRDRHRERGPRQRRGARRDRSRLRGDRPGRAVRRGHRAGQLPGPALGATAAGRAARARRAGRRPGAERRALGRRARPGRAERLPGQRRHRRREHHPGDERARQADPHRGGLRQLDHQHRRRLGRPRPDRGAAPRPARRRPRSCSTGSPRRAATRRSGPTWRRSPARCPPGAVASSASWLTAQSQAEGNGAIMEPFVSRSRSSAWRWRSSSWAT